MVRRAAEVLSSPPMTFKGLRSLARPLRRLQRSIVGTQDHFLKHCRGVIHVGANTGQERTLYASYGLNVVWIEPIPDVYDTLVANLRDVASTQRAIRALITDEAGREYDFHVANNDGMSSSILDLHQHRDIWPDVGYVRSIAMRSKTLPAALQEADIDLNQYDALVMDTQGSELLVLQGARPILGNFRFIKSEAANFESYRNCAKASDITEFLRAFGFRQIRRYRVAKGHAGGEYFELLFQRDASYLTAAAQSWLSAR